MAILREERGTRIGKSLERNVVIPAKAGLSTAELVIHLDLEQLAIQSKATWIPAFAGMTSAFHGRKLQLRASLAGRNHATGSTGETYSGKNFETPSLSPLPGSAISVDVPWATSSPPLSITLASA